MERDSLKEENCASLFANIISERSHAETDTYTAPFMLTNILILLLCIQKGCCRPFHSLSLFYHEKLLEAILCQSNVMASNNPRNSLL